MRKEAPKQKGYFRERLNLWREDAVLQFLSVRDQIDLWWSGICYEKLVGPLGEKLIETLYGCEVSQESQNNLDALNQHLEHGSAIAYLNHISLADGPLITLFLIDKLGGKNGNLQIFGGPESRKHYDLRRSPSASLLRIAPLLGVKLAPVVQSYDLKSYTRQERHKLLLKFKKNAIRILNHPGGVFMIAPGETRSQDGKLQRAKSGLLDLNNYCSQVELRYQPIAIIPKGTFNRNLGLGKVELKVGNPYSIDEIKQEACTKHIETLDAMMLRLAELLPPTMRGVYSDHLPNLPIQE